MSDRLTIVGPEPDEGDVTQRLDKVNIEALMLMAKYDSDFMTKLVNDREKALAESGIRFSPVEKMIITKIPGGKLLRNIDEFNVPGISRNSLSNWRKAAAVIMLITSVLFTAPHCQRFITKPSETETADGWQDNETYIIHSVAAPDEKARGIEERKKSSRRSAVLMAQYMILEKFKGEKIEAGGILYTRDEAEEELLGKYRNEIYKAIKNGTVIRETYDAEQNCEIIYSIHGEDLKKKCNNPDVWN